MVLKAVVKRGLRWPAEAIIASSKWLPGIIGNALNDALNWDWRVVKYFPSKRGSFGYILPKQPARGAELPVPPRDLWVGYGDTPEKWLKSGEVHFQAMMDIAEASGWTLQPGGRALEFGCAAARMTRWFYNRVEQCEIWGVDISADHIVWCQQHLSPPFHFATVTTVPHLPFEDNYFDFIFAGSVFTHIEDLADTWLLELRRILRPGGRIYVTVHDRHTLELMANPKYADKIYPAGRVGNKSILTGYFESYKKELNFLDTDWVMFTMERGAASQVFYDIDYLRQYWGRILRVISINPEAYDHQTAVLMTKD
jgi:ubiquinone/menaquinone biosynthesis C-methylase UbiE